MHDHFCLLLFGAYDHGRMGFDTTEKILLAALLPTEPSRTALRSLLQHVDWPAVLRRAAFHHTSALLRWNLSRAGCLDRVPAEIKAQLAEISRTWAARHLAYVNETRRLVRALRAEGIEAIPLKGAALMLGGAYPEAGLRAALDLDLLVRPAAIEAAEAVAESCGYAMAPGQRAARPRQRLENERNHAWPRRGPSGLILELHHRAFHAVGCGRDLDFDTIRGRAETTEDGLLLPADADLALHLIHHTIVDLQSAHAILRTLADLHALASRSPDLENRTAQLAREFEFEGAASIAFAAKRALAEGNFAGLAPDSDLTLLLETALLESPAAFAEAARLLEYLDFRRAPLQKLGNLAALLFTPRAHMEQLYERDSGPGLYWNYLRRPFDLLQKFNWRSLSPSHLQRVRRLRRMENYRGEWRGARDEKSSGEGRGTRDEW